MTELKEKRFTVKVTEKMHSAFKEYCNKRDVDVSDELRAYIRKCIEKDKK